MKHTSIPVLDTPCEFINITPVNPLISKCQIKVCYVGDQPNRNKSIITKDVAKELANSIPGSPIVGYYNEAIGDFEGHNKIIEISGGKIKLKSTTRPYGFVDLGAKVWFQKFVDDGAIEREYLMTEGYLWTGQFPEAKRIIENGNNQSMELSQEFLNAYWTKDNNGKPKFFIINEAIISKLCILGEEEEPCFEGASITQPIIQFSYDNEFKEQLFSMMTELKELIKEGGAPVFTTFAVEIGDVLWSAMYDFLEKNFPRDLCEGETAGCYRCSKYSIEGIYEDGTQKFAILRARDEEPIKLYRMNFVYDDNGLIADSNFVEVKKDYVPVSDNGPMFALDAVEAYEQERYKVVDNSQQEEDNKIENPIEGKTDFKKSEEDKCLECGKPLDECTCKKKTEYSLEDIPEYVELQTKYSTLEADFNTLNETNKDLKAQIETLTQFKAEVDRKEKQAMIDSFYMLSDEDKKDVVENIDSYSLDDIEGKLSIICVRNKVNFNLDNDNESDPTTYSLNGGGEGDYTPAWIKSVQSVAKDMNN